MPCPSFSVGDSLGGALHSSGAPPSSRARRAMTLVEVLTVIAVLVILAAIAVPAIQAARESANRASCANNLRQVATGMLAHETIRESLPHGGWSGGSAPVYKNGMAAQGKEQLAGWAFQILPQLDEELLHRRPPEVAIATPVEVYFCPSRGGTRVLPPSPAQTSLYVDNPQQGMYAIGQPIAHASIDYASAYVDPRCLPRNTPSLAEFCDPPSQAETSGCVVRLQITTNRVPPLAWSRLVGRSDIRDGLGHTLLIAEKRMNMQTLGDYQLDDDQGYTAGWDFDANRNASLPPERDYVSERLTLKNPKNYADEFRQLSQFGSAHSSGINAAFADGSVRHLTYGIEPLAFHRMGGRNDGRTLEERASDADRGQGHGKP
jgi:prepilin-type N-terminal cleavage/methylation domain-containing protein/prepilin-type processing-associated H-X9-DG protein